ncbi:MAG: signal peptide peptidase SppA [Bacillota bacterium]|nr:signal peptide peptidase SppA [Bacillota bacterium]
MAAVVALVLALSNYDAGSAARLDETPSVAVLHIEGTISDERSVSLYQPVTYNHQYILDTLEQLIADENNLGLLLYIDSPGGGVLQTAEIGELLQQYKEQTGRPVYAYGHDYAASGGYWLASYADQFIANSYCLTGSIGVIMGTMLDVSGFLAEHGIVATTLASGEEKDMGSNFEPLSEETRAIFMSIINEYYDDFVSVVAENRGMSVAQVRELADGRVYTARQAVANGLADQVGDYQQARQAICEALGVEEEALRDYQYLYQPNVLDFFYSLSNRQNSEVEALMQLAMPFKGPAVYYDIQADQD